MQILKDRELASERFGDLCSLVDVLARQANIDPEKIAYSMLRKGEIEEQVTYRELRDQSLSVARRLQRLGLAKGSAALLLFPSGLEFIIAFMGCLHAGVRAVPAVLPQKRQNKWQKTAEIARDAGCRLVCTTGESLDTVTEMMSAWFDDGEVDFAAFDLEEIALDATSSCPRAFSGMPELSRDDIAFLQYTSGSTGFPKGVAVTHANLLHNQEMMRKAFGHDRETVLVSWLPLFHDMGLIGNVLHTLYLGATCYLMTPVGFLQNPLLWLEALSRFRGTSSFAPNFAYDLCLRKITPAQREGLDLSSWRMALNGAEPIRVDTLEKFTAFFAQVGFRATTHLPAYGLAEATLFVSGTEHDGLPVTKRVSVEALRQNRIVESSAKQGTQELVSSGVLSGDQDIRIVDPDNARALRDGSVGEIWISGGSVAKGYWNKPAATAETFHAQIEGEPGRRYLRTGDLGFVDGGQLYITGRLKDVIIINGANFYPQDIEMAIADIEPAFRKGACAAFGVNVDGGERVVIVQEIERVALRQFDGEAAMQGVRAAIATHFQIPLAAIILIKPMMLPLTSSGKIQRRQCRSMYESRAFAPVAAWYAQGAEVLVDETTQAKAEAPFSQKAASLGQWLRDYAARHIDGFLINERRAISPHILMDFAREGLLGLEVAPNFGGIGLNTRDSLHVIAALAAIDTTIAAMVGVHNFLGILPIRRFGNAQQKATLLPDLAQGRRLGALAITEPGAGSNLNAIRAEALPQPDGSWRVKGSKSWIGNAGWSGVINLFVQLTDHEGRKRGVTAFVVERDSAGLDIAEEAPTMGMRGMVQNRINLNGLIVTRQDMLGAMGQGIEVAQSAMMYGRLAIAAMSLGAMRRSLQLAMRYTIARRVATGLLAENMVTRTRIADQLMAIHAIDAVVSGMAADLDAGIALPPEIFAMSKITAPELLWRGVDQSMQMMGGRGYCENNDLARIFRDTRLYRIFEGPTETLTAYLGSALSADKSDLAGFYARSFGGDQGLVELRAIEADLRKALQMVPADAPCDEVQETQLLNDHLGRIGALILMRGYVRRGDPNGQCHVWLNHQIEKATTEARQHITAIKFCDYNHMDCLDALDREIGPGHRAQFLLETAFDLPSHPQPVTPRVPHDQSTESVQTPRDVDAAVQWIADWLSRHASVPRRAVTSETVFAEAGIDSVKSVEFAFDLEARFRQVVAPTVVWECPTVGDVARFIAREAHETEVQPIPAAPDERARLQRELLNELN